MYGQLDGVRSILHNRKVYKQYVNTLWWCFAYSTFSNYFTVYAYVETLFIIVSQKFHKHTKTHESEQELTKFMYRGEIVVRYKTIQNFNRTQPAGPLSHCAKRMRSGAGCFVGAEYGAIVICRWWSTISCESLFKCCFTWEIIENMLCLLCACVCLAQYICKRIL